jgi:hypothetical protein
MVNRLRYAEQKAKALARLQAKLELLRNATGTSGAVGRKLNQPRRGSQFEALIGSSGFDEEFRASAGIGSIQTSLRGTRDEIVKVAKGARNPIPAPLKIVR